MLKFFAPPGWRSLAALVLGLFCLMQAGAGDTAETTIRVGILSGEDEDIWKVVATNAAAGGLTVRIVTFGE